MSMLATAIVSKLCTPHMSSQEKLILLYLADAHDEVTGLCEVDMEQLAVDTCLTDEKCKDENGEFVHMPLSDWLSVMSYSSKLIHELTHRDDEFEYVHGRSTFKITCLREPAGVEA